MSFDAAYEALTDHDDDARWAYGTGFADPLAGVDSTIPGDADRADLAAYCLMLGDDALVLSHRLQQWVTRAPELEDELAIANIALDLLGQARLLLSRAGQVEGAGRDEDALAYLRDPGDFRNVRLAERTDDDFAHLIARLLVFATWRLALLDRLAATRDPVLAAIGAKGVKEVTYHRDYAAQWAIRLGDGTSLSRDRMRAALDAVEPLIGELFHPHDIEVRLAAAGVAVDPSSLRPEFDAVLAQVRRAATFPPAGTGVTAANASYSSAGVGVAQAGVVVPPAEGGATPADAGLPQTEIGLPQADAGLPQADDGLPQADDGLPQADGVLPSADDLLRTGTPSKPARNGQAGPGGYGRDGVHGAALTELLGEMQGLARELPGGVW